MRLILSSLCGVLLCVYPAWSTQSLTSLVAAPDSIFVNAPTVITFTVAVAPDPGLIENSVDLVMAGSGGAPATVIGSLYDDGTHGDAVAGDGIYTGQFPITQSTVGTIQLFASAAYTRALHRVDSNSVVVNIFRHRTQADIQTLVLTQQHAQLLFEKIQQQSGDAAAQAATIKYLLGQRGVNGAGLSSDGQTVWASYTDGLYGAIVASPLGTQGALPREIQARRKGSVPSVCTAAARPADPETAFVSSPFYSSFAPDDASVVVANDLSGTCAGQVSAFLDSNATLGQLYAVNQYSIIHLNTHGGILNGSVLLVTNEASNANSQRVYEADLLSGKLITCGTTFCVTPAFFGAIAGTAGFPNSIVFASACETLGVNSVLNTTLSDAFLSHGAAAFLGWNNSVTTTFNTSVAEQLYSVLANMSTPAQSRTIGIAFNSLPSWVDPGGEHATIFLLGNHNRTLCVPATPQPTWTQKFPMTIPPSRSRHAMAYDINRQLMVMFGGCTAGPGNSCNQLNDTWVWDGANWTKKSPATSPPARTGHAMAYDAARGQVVLFGGDIGGQCTDCSDTWIWDGTNWTQKFPSSRPPRRYAHAMAYDPVRRVVVLFGGADVEGPLFIYNDTWIWDGTNWTQQFPATVPPSRYDHGMAYDTQTQGTIVIGGWGYTSTLTDTWSWNGSTWTLVPSPNSGAFMFEPRLAYEQQNARLLLLFSDGSVMETWTWDGSNWKNQFPPTSPTVRDLTAMQYDATRGQVVVFGGAPHAQGQLSDTWVWPQP